MSPPGSVHDAKPTFGERHFRDVLATFATGVTIITTRYRKGESAGGLRYVGFTANSFNSVSLKPPLVVWSLSQAANNRLAFEQCERYAISVLAADQVELARRFSRPHLDRFDGVPYTLGWSDAPRIDGALAWLECRHFAWQPTGDHTLFVGEVVECARAGGAPLVFYDGEFVTAAAVE
ncbi:MAG TPA: flavin reductase family protein [Casimicrobiaceae bacterium]|nr:flavin reductase family protein [Casimicrobiaceae bacterium]